MERTWWLRFLVGMAVHHSSAGKKKTFGARFPLLRPFLGQQFTHTSPLLGVRYFHLSKSIFWRFPQHRSPFRGLSFQQHGGGAEGQLFPLQPPQEAREGTPFNRTAASQQAEFQAALLRSLSENKTQMDSAIRRAFPSSKERTWWLCFLARMAAHRRARMQKKLGAKFPLSSRPFIAKGRMFILHFFQVPDPWNSSMDMKMKEGPQPSPSQWRFPRSVVPPTVKLKQFDPAFREGQQPSPFHWRDTSSKVPPTRRRLVPNLSKKGIQPLTQFHFTFSFAEGHQPNMKKDQHEEQPALWLHHLCRRQQHRKVIFKGLHSRCKFRSPYNEEGHAKRPFCRDTSSPDQRRSKCSKRSIPHSSS